MAEFVCSGGNDKQRKDSQNISGTVREEHRRFSIPADFCQCVGKTVFSFTFTLLSRNTNEREDAPMRQRILVPGVEWKFKDRNRCQIQINEIAIPYHNDDDVLSSTWSTVRLVSHDPASRNFFHFFLMKESRYSNNRHIIVTALSPSGRRNI